MLSIIGAIMILIPVSGAALYALIDLARHSKAQKALYTDFAEDFSENR